MDKNLLKLPYYATIAGIILRLSYFTVIPRLIQGANQENMETTFFFLQLLFSVILFMGIGILLRKGYDRKTFFKSATLLVVYFTVLLIIEQTTQYFGVYSMLVYYLYLPSEVFSWIILLLVRIFPRENMTWIIVIPSILAPYLLVLFAKKREDNL